MGNNNKNIQNNREFIIAELDAQKERQRQERKKMKQDKEEFLYNTELISFKDIIVCSCPEIHNKNHCLRLCEKTKSGTIKFFGIDEEFNESCLGHNEEDIHYFVYYDENNNLCSKTQHIVNVLDIVNSTLCQTTLNKDSLNFLRKNFKQNPLPMFRRQELKKLDREFVDLQLGKNTNYGQSTFENFEK